MREAIKVGKVIGTKVLIMATVMAVVVGGPVSVQMVLLAIDPNIPIAP
ncbi:hypothetical protein ACTXJX_11830 [Glutamicibacter ardleyensis]